MKTKYLDVNGQTICYGDILKIISMESREKNENSIRTPFAMLVKYSDSKNMMYISGMDEFWEISECQCGVDKGTNKLSDFEIFAERAVYEANLNRLKEQQ